MRISCIPDSRDVQLKRQEARIELFLVASQSVALEQKLVCATDEAPLSVKNTSSRLLDATNRVVL